MCGTAISDMAFSKFCGRFWTTSGCHCETLAVTALVLRPMPCQRGEAQTMGVDSFVRPSDVFLSGFARARDARHESRRGLGTLHELVRGPSARSAQSAAKHAGRGRGQARGGQ